MLTSGGDAPGMNAAIWAIIKLAATRGIEVVGVERGYDGLIDGDEVNTYSTDPLDDDSDDDGWVDGEEDTNHNGKVDPGEKDPNRYNAKAMPCIPLLLLAN